MNALRRLVVLLVSGLLALVAVAPTAAQSTGDGPSAGPSAQAQDAGPPGTLPPLTPEPQPPRSRNGAGGTGGRGAGEGTKRAGARRKAPEPPGAGPGSGSPSATSIPRTELPNTGAEAGVIGLLGAALMLLGVGLRLRIADARA